MLLNKVASNKSKTELEQRFCELLGLQSLWDKLTMEQLPNLQEIREVDFWWHRASWSFQAELWCGQIKLADVDPNQMEGFRNPAWGNLFLYLDDSGSHVGGGYAVVWNYNWMSMAWNVPKPPAGWNIIPPVEFLVGDENPAFPAVRYFTWTQCLHEWKETGPVERRHRGWHEYTCTKCGARPTVDSGD